MLGLCGRGACQAGASPAGQQRLTFPGMALTSEYLNRLLTEVKQGLTEEQDGVNRVALEHGPEGLLITMEAVGRRLSYDVNAPAYHYEPDGSDSVRHATWLVQLFDEEAR